MEGDTLFGDIAVLFSVVIEITRDLASISPDLVDIFFELIEFFDHIDWDDNVVVGEVEDGMGIVKQYVGIEDEVFGGHAASFVDLGARLREWDASLVAVARASILGPSEQKVNVQLGLVAGRVYRGCAASETCDREGQGGRDDGELGKSGGWERSGFV